MVDSAWKNNHVMTVSSSLENDEGQCKTIDSSSLSLNCSIQDEFNGQSKRWNDQRVFFTKSSNDIICLEQNMIHAYHFGN